MTGRQGRTLSGEPARSEEEELKRKTRNKWLMGEALGSKDDGSSRHPRSKLDGMKAESNVGEDLLSGDEGIDFDPL